MANQVICDRCGHKESDSRHFWHVPEYQLDFCLKCMEQYNHEKVEVLAKIEAFTKASLKTFHARFVMPEHRITIEEESPIEVYDFESGLSDV